MRTKPTTIDTNGTPANYQVHQAAIHNPTSVAISTQSTTNLAFISLTGSGFDANQVFTFRAANTSATIGVGCEI